MSAESITAIIIAFIGGLTAVWAAYVSNRNSKATRDITQVLNNTKTPVDSLDQVVRLLQEELNRTNQRHDQEREFFNQELNRLRAEHASDRQEWERSEFKMQAEIDKLIDERNDYLDEIKRLQKQLGKLEEQVRSSLDSVKKLGDI